MKNNKDKNPQPGRTEEDKNKAINQTTDTSALKNSATSSQNNTSDGQTSGGAMPPIQGANQSRQAEQGDLR